MKRRIPRLLTAALVAALAAACSPGGGSIYYTIETEPIAADSSLPNAITVFDVAKMNTTYFVGAGKIWTGTASGAGTTADPRKITWDVTEPLPVQPPTATAICTGLVVSPFDGTKLYGSFYDDAGSAGLYLSTAAPTFEGIDPEPLPVAGSQVALLKAVNDGGDRLVAVTTWQAMVGTELSFVFGIVYSASAGSYVAATFDATRAAGEEKKPINDVIYAGGSINAWFATEGSTLYTNPGAGFAGNFTKVNVAGIAAGEVLAGLFFDGTTLYVASSTGKVYYSTNGTSWLDTPAPDISGVHPPLLRFGGPIGTGILLVGSDGYGYYLLDTKILASTDPLPLSRCTTTTIDLHTDTVRSFFLDWLDPVEPFGFALTSMGGLWRGKISGGDITGWGQE